VRVLHELGPDAAKELFPQIQIDMHSTWFFDYGFGWSYADDANNDDFEAALRSPQFDPSNTPFISFEPGDELASITDVWHFVRQVEPGLFNRELGKHKVEL